MQLLESEVCFDVECTTTKSKFEVICAVKRGAATFHQTSPRSATRCSWGLSKLVISVILYRCSQQKLRIIFKNGPGTWCKYGCGPLRLSNLQGPFGPEDPHTPHVEMLAPCTPGFWNRGTQFTSMGHPYLGTLEYYTDAAASSTYAAEIPGRAKDQKAIDSAFLDMNFLLRFWESASGAASPRTHKIVMAATISRIHGALHTSDVYVGNEGLLHMTCQNSSFPLFRPSGLKTSMQTSRHPSTGRYRRGHASYPYH